MTWLLALLVATATAQQIRTVTGDFSIEQGETVYVIDETRLLTVPYIGMSEMTYKLVNIETGEQRSADVRQGDLIEIAPCRLVVVSLDGSRAAFVARCEATPPAEAADDQPPRAPAPN